MTEKTEITLGDKVKCKISGFTGIAISRRTYLHGCNRINVQPRVSKSGAMSNPVLFFEADLEVVDETKSRKSVGFKFIARR